MCRLEEPAPAPGDYRRLWMTAAKKKATPQVPVDRDGPRAPSQRPAQEANKVVASNRRARHDYEILDTSSAASCCRARR